VGLNLRACFRGLSEPREHVEEQGVLSRRKGKELLRDVAARIWRDATGDRLGFPSSYQCVDLEDGRQEADLAVRRSLLAAELTSTDLQLVNTIISTPGLITYIHLRLRQSTWPSQERRIRCCRDSSRRLPPC
jgi:hypothetical protein